jgi:hypothetical protein
MRVNTVAQDLGCSIDEAQEAMDNNQVKFDIRTGKYYLSSH